MRTLLIVLWMLLGGIASAAAQVSVGIGMPGISIGINLPVYPQLVRVPGYPVYYAPQMNSNYFFYDGLYWVYQRDNWYASSWYNGPWSLVGPEAVPLYVLRVPVRYYRQPPAYFHGWRSDAPPRWDEHWGNSWSQSHSGWNNWNRSAVPAPAPLPSYQRQYSGSRYPQAEQQHALQSQNYRYQPQEAVTQQHYQSQRNQSPQSPPPSAPQARKAAPQERVAPQQEQRATGRPTSTQQAAPPPQRVESQQRGNGNAQKPAAPQAPPQQSGSAAQRQGQQPQQGTAQREQKPPKAQAQDKAQHGNDKAQQGQDKGSQGKGTAQEAKQGQGKGQDKGEQQGGEHSK
jgi:hypothetical protein